MNFDTLYRRGIKNVWSIDADSQNKYLNVIQNVRGMHDVKFQKLNALFVPNTNYIRHFFGEKSEKPEYGIYDEAGACFWDNCLVFPIYNVADQIVSLAGFNPFQYVKAKELGDKSINYYTYSPKHVFAKGRYLFYTEGTYFRALKEGCLFLTDGIFDTLSLSVAGFQAAALMGSSLTQEIAMQLRFIPRVVLMADNDSAGMKLYRHAAQCLRNIEIAKQGRAKDIDELLKKENREQALAWLRCIEQGKAGYKTWIMD